MYIHSFSDVETKTLRSKTLSNIDGEKGEIG